MNDKEQAILELKGRLWYAIIGIKAIDEGLLAERPPGLRFWLVMRAAQIAA